MNRTPSRGLSVIVISFLIALFLAMLPLPPWLYLFWPQWLVMVVIYWVLALPYRVSLGIAWLLGLILDGLTGSLLGEHALALTIVIYLTDRFHQQIRVFPVWQQAVCVFILVLIYQAILAWIQGMLGLLGSGYLFWIAAVTSMIVWPLVFITLRSVRQKFRVS